MTITAAGAPRSTTVSVRRLGFLAALDFRLYAVHEDGTSGAFGIRRGVCDTRAATCTAFRAWIIARTVGTNDEPTVHDGSSRQKGEVKISLNIHFRVYEWKL